MGLSTQDMLEYTSLTQTNREVFKGWQKSFSIIFHTICYLHHMLSKKSTKSMGLLLNY